MSLRTTCMAAVCALGLGILPVNAATIVNDDFESYTSQANFEATWTPIGTVAPLSGNWSTAQASSPTHSVEVVGTTTNSQQRNRRSFAETGTVDAASNTSIIWSFDFYDTNGGASPYRQFSNMQDTTAPSATNQLIAMGLNNNQTSANSGGNYYMARILGYTVPTTADPDGGPAESVGGSGAFFKLNDFGVGLRSTGWHNLKVKLSTDDGLSTDYEFYVDGNLAERVSNIGTAASIRSYDNIAIGSGLSNASNGAYFDNVNLAVVPEPASLLLTGLACIGLLAVRRRGA
jgi:hypothetical protein